MHVLVAGAAGYVGSRLVPALLSEGHTVTAGMREPARASRYAWSSSPDVRVLGLDLLEEDSVEQAVTGVDAIFYLVHSMGDGEGFVARDRRAAYQLARAAESAGVQRLVYLSGILPPAVPDEQLSVHLRSRHQVEEILVSGGVPALVLRAAIVIGAGSTSFEILRQLSERLPVVPVPAWLTNQVQPIAIEDVVRLLLAGLRGEPRHGHYDIGGDEVLSYAELVERYAEVARLQRVQVRVPIPQRRLAGAAAGLVAGVPAGTVQALFDSLGHDLVCGDHVVREVLDGAEGPYLSVREALERSLAEHPLPDDSQAAREGDPPWTGGNVSLDEGRAHRSGSLLDRLLLGLPRR
ncbi:NAD(P)H-binding protein [Ornithinicoccus halotolerans]|uniref:NAD(P)H-binding protein n=1 Tax=Ornithinicoccus halotolerans TaxID=1748220 RepID=UPI0018861AC5|nr:NAD(P)H-binding protein [Ornithinicoccus halotolerans]